MRLLTCWLPITLALATMLGLPGVLCLSADTGLVKRAEPGRESEPPNTEVDKQRDIPRRTEMEKLQARPKQSYAPNTRWVVCMDNCLAELEPTNIRYPVELALWQQVMRYRLCNYKRCSQYDGRKFARQNDRLPLGAKKVYHWRMCMDYCGNELAFQAPWGTVDLPAQETLDHCKEQCRGREVASRKGTYVYSPLVKVREQVLGKEAWFDTPASPPSSERKEGTQEDTYSSMSENLLGRLGQAIRHLPHPSFGSSAAPRLPPLGNGIGILP